MIIRIGVEIREQAADQYPAAAGIDPAEISYVEAHGTGTPSAEAPGPPLPPPPLIYSECRA